MMYAHPEIYMYSRSKDHSWPKELWLSIYSYSSLILLYVYMYNPI